METRDWIITLRTKEFYPTYKRVAVKASTLFEAAKHVDENNELDRFEVVKIEVLE